MRLTSLRRSGSPARHTVSTEAGIAPCSTSSAMADGTLLIRLMSGAAAPLHRSRMVSTSTTWLPPESGAKISKIDRSKQIEVEHSTLRSSAAENCARDHCKKLVAAPWAIITPFGKPVEPEV